MAKDNYDYDAIIIGAGISGLVCGCYLAKAGLKTLIVEKNAKPGGYCTSFKREGFLFDACVSFISGFGENGSLYKIFNYFDLKDRIKIGRNPIPDIVITHNNKIKLYSDIKRLEIELRNYFPDQKNGIKSFLEILATPDILSITKFRNTNFKDVLDNYFTNDGIKTILGIIMVGYSGIPISQISALAAISIYRDFLLDGGYYPEGGMQSFSNILAKKFTELGGKILLSQKVKNIIVKNNSVRGVILKNNVKFTLKILVAACDINELFFNLLENKRDVYLDKIRNRQESLSGFLVYLGMNESFDLKRFTDLTSHVWIIPKNYNNIEKIYSDLLCNNYGFVGITSPSLKNNILFQKTEKNSLFLFVNTPYRNNLFWNTKNKNLISKDLIKMAEKFFPNLSNNIKKQINVSPHDLFKWTLNYRGAAYGWASNINQFCDPDFSEKTKIDSLYITGHWLNRTGGVTTVADIGFKTAKRIVSEYHKR